MWSKSTERDDTLFVWHNIGEIEKFHFSDVEIKRIAALQ